MKPMLLTWYVWCITWEILHWPGQQCLEFFGCLFLASFAKSWMSRRHTLGLTTPKYYCHCSRFSLFVDKGSDSGSLELGDGFSREIDFNNFFQISSWTALDHGMMRFLKLLEPTSLCLADHIYVMSRFNKCDVMLPVKLNSAFRKLLLVKVTSWFNKGEGVMFFVCALIQLAFRNGILYFLVKRC